MPTRRVELTEDLERFVLEQVQSGRYENASAVVRAGLRKLENEEPDDAASMEALRAAIQDGIDSGVASGDVFARVRLKFNLPPRQTAS